MLSSMFSKLTQLFVARDIQEPWLPVEISPAMTLEDALDAVLEISNPNPVEIYPVRLDGCVVGLVDWPMLEDSRKEEYRGLGILTPEDFGWVGEEDVQEVPPDVPRRRVGEVMASIAPSALVSADTSVFATAKLLCEAERGTVFVVVEGNQLTGTLTYGDLFKTPFRTSLFGMLIQMEELALDLVCLEPQKSWLALSPKRQEKAREEYAREYVQEWKKQDMVRHAQPASPHPYARSLPMTDWRTCEIKGNHHSYPLLQRAQFCDKREIIVKRNLLQGLSGTWVNEVFRKAERLRNQCAHSGGFREGIMHGKDLWDLIADVHKLIREIIKAGRLDVRPPPEEQLMSGPA